MAGPHQIWKLDLDKNEVSTFAGSGREAATRWSTAVNRVLRNLRAWRCGGQTLYVADSESNIIRAIDLATGRVKTLVGGDLFEFGDVDGSGDDVRLQHPLGLLAYRRQDIDRRHLQSQDQRTRSRKRQRVNSLFGTGKPGQADGAAPSFYEPGGLALANEKLYIADTNNHAIRVVDLKTKQTSTLRSTVSLHRRRIRRRPKPPSRQMPKRSKRRHNNCARVQMLRSKSTSNCRRLSSQSRWRHSVTKFPLTTQEHNHRRKTRFTERKRSEASVSHSVECRQRRLGQPSRAGDAVLLS